MCVVKLSSCSLCVCCLGYYFTCVFVQFSVLWATSSNSKIMQGQQQHPHVSHDPIELGADAGVGHFYWNWCCLYQLYSYFSGKFAR